MGFSLVLRCIREAPYLTLDLSEKGPQEKGPRGRPRSAVLAALFSKSAPFKMNHSWRTGSLRCPASRVRFQILPTSNVLRLDSCARALGSGRRAAHQAMQQAALDSLERAWLLWQGCARASVAAWAGQAGRGRVGRCVRPQVQDPGPSLSASASSASGHPHSSSRRPGRVPRSTSYTTPKCKEPLCGQENAEVE